MGGEDWTPSYADHVVQDAVARRSQRESMHCVCYDTMSPVSCWNLGTTAAMKHAVPVAVAVGIAVLVTAVASIAKCYLNVEPGAISAGIAACGLWVALRVALNWRNQLVTARRLDAVQEYWTAVQLLKHQVGAFKEGVKRLLPRYWKL